MKKILSTILFSFFVLIISAQAQVERSTEKIVIEGKKYYIHTIQSGHTLYSISKAYGVSVDEINAANPDIEEKLKLGQTIKIPIFDPNDKKNKYITYVIKPGDTLYSLCRKYNITTDVFFEINSDLKSDAPLKTNQKVKLPKYIIENQITEDCIDTAKYTCHLVIKGETLYGISKKYNVTKEEIINANPDISNRSLKVGEIIQIPKISKYIPNKDEIFIDSLSKVNQKESSNKNVTITDNTEKTNNTLPCDSSKWYKNRKSFEISILLPFEEKTNMKNLYNQERSNRKQFITDLSKDMTAFYTGCLLALDNINESDINSLKINVYDIGRNNDVLVELVNSEKLLNSDIIIGPAFKSQVEYVNEKFANNDTVTFILPFINDDDVLKRFSNNIMVSPSLSSTRESIIKYVSSIPNQNIIIIQSSNPESIKMASEYQNLFKQYYNGVDKAKIIKYDGKNLVSLNSIVNKDMENVFISTIDDEASITQIFTNLFPLKNYEITFIGDESILDYETIDPLYYSKVKFTYYSSSYIDYTKPETDIFVKKYRETFLFEPTNYSFVGYDITNYFVDVLIRYGDNFTKCLGDNFLLDGQSGKMMFNRASSYKKHSFSNNITYIYSLQPNYSFILEYPKSE